MSKAERLLSYSLLSLITSKPIASVPAPGMTDDEEEDDNNHLKDKTKGLLNSNGAWCWREDCSGKFFLLQKVIHLDFISYLECLKLTKAVQRTCETLQTVANLYDGHVRVFPYVHISILTSFI